VAAEEAAAARREPELRQELDREDRPDRPPDRHHDPLRARRQLDRELVPDEEREHDAEPRHERIGAFRRAAEPELEPVVVGVATH
jgi:hypothetical protein